MSYSNYQYTEQEHKQFKADRFLGKGFARNEEKLLKQLLMEQQQEIVNELARS